MNDLVKLCRLLLITNGLLLVLLILSTATNVWLARECLYFGNEAVKANEAHERTLKEQAEYLDKLEAGIRGGKARP